MKRERRDAAHKDLRWQKRRERFDIAAAGFAPNTIIASAARISGDSVRAMMRGVIVAQAASRNAQTFVSTKTACATCSPSTAQTGCTSASGVAGNC